jgi:hypothetical protein
LKLNAAFVDVFSGEIMVVKVGGWGTDRVLLFEGAWVGNRDLFPASFGCRFGGFSGVHGCFELGKMRVVCSSCVVEGDGVLGNSFSRLKFLARSNFELK